MMRGCLVAENCLYEKALEALDDERTAIRHVLNVRNHSGDDFVIGSLHFSSFELPGR